MINKQELRIGNLVHYKGDVCAVEEIACNGVTLESTVYRDYQYATEKDIFPIYLTRSIVNNCLDLGPKEKYRVEQERDSFYFYDTALSNLAIKQVTTLHNVQNLYCDLAEKELNVRDVITLLSAQEKADSG
jgi:hypothetical protein